MAQLAIQVDFDLSSLVKAIWIRKDGWGGAILAWYFVQGYPVHRFIRTSNIVLSAGRKVLVSSLVQVLGYSVQVLRTLQPNIVLSVRQHEYFATVSLRKHYYHLGHIHRGMS